MHHFTLLTAEDPAQAIAAHTDTSHLLPGAPIFSA
jgi:hypothetical protein